MLLQSARAGSAVGFQELMEAAEANLNEARLPVSQVVTDVFDMHFGGGGGERKLGAQDLLAFFAEYKSYFEPEDLREFAEELRLLGPLTVSTLASKLRSDLAFLPR